MMKRIIAFMLFMFTLASVNAQVGSPKRSDLFLSLAKSKPDTGRIDILIQIANYYYNRTDLINGADSVEFYVRRADQLNKKFDIASFQNSINIFSAYGYSEKHPDKDAKSLFIPLINTCRRSGDKAHEMLAWQILAEEIDSNPQSAPFKITCYQNAMSLAHQLNNGQDEMAFLKNIADLHLQQRKFDLAENELFQVLKNSKKAGSRNVLFSYDLLSAVYITNGKYDKALFYAIKTEKMMQATGDSISAVTFYGRLAQIYGFLGEPGLAVQWCMKALNHCIQTNDTALIFRISGTAVGDLIKAGKPKDALKFILHLTAKHEPQKIDDMRLVQKAIGDSYAALGKNDLAEKSYLEMIRLGNEEQYNYHNYDKASNNFTMGRFYIAAGKYSNAKKYLSAALKAYQETGSVIDLKDVYLSLFKVDSALGNYKDAITHLQQNNKLKDSLFNAAKNKQIEELGIKYETAQKDKDFRLLQGKEKLEQAKLQQAQNTRNWIIAGTFMVLIIAGLLYRQSAIRKKSNQLITHKNELLEHLLAEKEWLLKEVHHRVKNNLHTVICLLESQARYLENDALKAIENSQHRIYAMSLIHQKLYQSDDIKTIGMAEYIPELVNALEEGFGTSNQIKFKLKIDPVNLNISHAIPLGLIINEAVTNSIKYAFPNNRKGEISIAMLNFGGRIKLELADNGIGMPQIDKEAEPESLGLRLMKGLSEDIDAEISFKVDNGTTIRIVFKPEILNKPGSLPEPDKSEEILYA